MTRRQAIEQAIERKYRQADALKGELTKILNEINELERYRYEQSKPGFTTKGWRRQTRPGRTETYIIQSEHGQRQGLDDF